MAYHLFAGDWRQEDWVSGIGLVCRWPMSEPRQRFDYIFSAWPRKGGVGHPVNCEVLGDRPPEQDPISDHYGLLADLRY